MYWQSLLSPLSQRPLLSETASSEFHYLLRPHCPGLDIAKPSDHQTKTVGELAPWVDGFILRQHSLCESLIIKELYQRFLWDYMSTFVESLPEDKKLATQTFQQEDLSVAKQQMLSVRHTVDSTAKSVATSVALRWFSWLKNSQPCWRCVCTHWRPSLWWGSPF